MALFSDDWEDYGESAHAVYRESAHAAYGPPLATVQTVSTKIPPAFDGRSSWFAYEEAIDDWCDVTELDPEKRGPALRNRLDGDAAVYKTLLDRDLLRDPANGVNYFKHELRPHFVKGNQSVFLWRFFQLFKAYRGQQDMLRWIGRMSVLRKRLTESWMDLFEPADENNPAFLRDAAQAAVVNGFAWPPQDDEMQLMLQDWNNAQRRRHAANFPLSDNLFALILTVLADLSEMQRERMSSTMALRGQRVNTYTYDMVREIFVELFCAPRSSLENPNLRAGSQGRSFCILEEGDMDGIHGFWVEDDESLEVGFLPELEDVFWTFDDEADAWISRHFRGRRLRRGGAKGGGKGRGRGGKRRFSSSKGRKGKGKQKGDNHAHWQDEAETVAWAKEKEKGRKDKKKGNLSHWKMEKEKGSHQKVKVKAMLLSTMQPSQLAIPHKRYRPMETQLPGRRTVGKKERGQTLSS